MSRHRHSGRPKGSKNKEADYDAREFEPLLSPETKRGIAIVFLLALSVVSLLALFDLAGVLGNYIKTLLTYLFGWATWLFPIILLALTYLMILPSRYAVGFINYFGLILLTLSFNGLLHLKIPLEKATETITSGRGGGYLGLFLSWPLQKIMGFWATLVVLIALLIIAFLITFNTSLESIAEKSLIFNSLWEKIKRLFSRRNKTEEEYYADEESYEEESKKQENKKITKPEEGEPGGAGSGYAGEAVPIEFAKKKLSEKKTGDDHQPLLAKKYKKIDIPLDLLLEQKEKPTAGDIRINQERIRKTLENFGIPVEMGDVSIGPTVTQYTLKPAEGIKLSQITTLHNDLALALAAHPIRIEAPIPGKALVGIEVPNQSIATVGLREILASREFATRKSSISIALGKDVAGQPWVANMETMPHMLIAGATGSGKTVCINSIIISLLYQNSPTTLRLIMIDPKRVELPVYNGVPHLLTPVITDVKKTINALKWTISEMDRRFELLARTGHRDIQSFNRASAEKMPYLVLLIDELADLMQASASEVEGYIIRLAQLARATGIHLVLATQRPSVDIITGLIKANITTRIAFAVASGTDSRTILDHAGAEKLLGRGDMLYISASLSKPKRLQGTFVSDDEIRRIVEYIKGQNGQPEYDESITAKPTNGNGSFNYDEEGDELLDEAKDLVIKAGKASASYLQRRLRIGYARAARLLDLLEQEGIIGPGDGAKPREILVSQEDDFERDNLELEDQEETEEEEPGEAGSGSAGETENQEEPDNDEKEDDEEIEELVDEEGEEETEEEPDEAREEDNEEEEEEDIEEEENENEKTEETEEDENDEEEDEDKPNKKINEDELI
jgi:S-DNA-T family DNA segregation ATPase FtsK/SpoIIIE